MTLNRRFPFKSVFDDFIDEYSGCSTYWYIPKWRTLSEVAITQFARILKIIFDEYLDRKWTRETQDSLLKRLISEEILEPYVKNQRVPDRTALVRILKKELEILGLLWLEDGKALTITDAGLSLMNTLNEGTPSQIVEEQILKFQYPNPTMPELVGFGGILPHLFLLQILNECDNRITFEEYDLFLNLARDQADVARISKFIKHWREIKETESEIILKLVRQLKRPKGDLQRMLDLGESESGEKKTRFKLISQASSYQRAFFAFPRHLLVDAEQSEIRPRDVSVIKQILAERLKEFKVTVYKTVEDWFAYFGDPKQRPSWFTHLTFVVKSSRTQEEAAAQVNNFKEHLTEQESLEIKRLEIEKGIENFYVSRLEMLEPGLSLVREGRQFTTPIGRMDLLCKGSDGKYVVVEIKAQEADDGVFGQILRYMGWVHGNFEDGNNNVRGLILAANFPETARYSRIGLLKEDHKAFLKFKEHGLNVTEV